MTHAECAAIAPHLPFDRRLGRPCEVDVSEVVKAIFYILRAGCPWRMLPKDLPPRPTLQRYFYAWQDQGIWQSINHRLVMIAREEDDLEASSNAGVIDSQWVKTTESGGPSGYDAGKKAKGRKCHVLTDTIGLLVTAIVHVPSVRYRDGATDLLTTVRTTFQWLRHVFADGAYAGDKLASQLPELGSWTFEIVRRSDTAKGFEVLP
jgi:transposase